MAQTVVFLSCTKSKKDYECEAQELYSASPMFQKTLDYSKQIKPDKTFILSAKHYLVPLTKKIAPYDMTLKEMSADEKSNWGNIIAKQAPKFGLDLNKDNFIFLTGSEYAKPFKEYIPEKNMSFPLEGKRFGERLKWLNSQIGQIKELFFKIKTIIYENFSR